MHNFRSFSTQSLMLFVWPATRSHSASQSSPINFVWVLDAIAVVLMLRDLSYLRLVGSGVTRELERVTVDSFHFPITNASLQPFFALPDQVLRDLHGACRNAPTNPHSGLPFLVVVIIDDAHAHAVFSQVFSLGSSRLPRSAVWFVSFGKWMPAALRRLGCNVIPYGSDDVREFERYKMKLVMAALLTHFPVECFVLDSDVVLFDDFLALWRYGCDAEFSCDDRTGVSIAELQPGFQINSGCVRWSPTDGARTFIRAAWERVLHVRPTRDQALLNSFLHGRSIGPALWELEFGETRVNYSVVEPSKVANGCIVFCLGRERLCRYAKEHGIQKPYAVHFNYHAPATAKLRTLRLLNLQAKKAIKRGDHEFAWPFWENCTFPEELVCDEWRITEIDRPDNSTPVTQPPIRVHKTDCVKCRKSH
jgi:hypothetical protein